MILNLFSFCFAGPTLVFRGADVFAILYTISQAFFFGLHFSSLGFSISISQVTLILCGSTWELPKNIIQLLFQLLEAGFGSIDTSINGQITIL